MWDDVYSAEQYVYGSEPNEFLLAHSSDLPQGRVLCIGDGEGRNSVYLARQGYQVTAVDLSAVGIAKAKKLAARYGVSVDYIQADLAQFSFGENQWDAIVSIFCHLPAPLRKRVHQQVIDGLKPGGVFLLEGYTPRQLQFGTGGPKAVEMLLDKDEVASELAALNMLHLQALDRQVIEGVKHTGTGAVLQLLAQK
ncbi:class I SAM-dependent methyltransferase [Shewanella sp. A32]|uniref:class I SAM-dependent methyltransferase n=1 Tax=Shewanella sp. A32 TaxID=3031327 RepID=UPI0023B97034|nr:class I SAM-dependent methyltransferase [Shewanella sp. A32]MDF0535790.1 class I SAM-dependent methyltransferase [Shewanella sp. A32]